MKKGGNDRLADNKILKFELSPRNLKIKKLLNQDFLEVEMKAISNANPNRNGSYFTKGSMEKAIPTFYNKPILASFDVKDDDFRGHEGTLKYDPELEQAYYDYTDINSETPLGLIRSEDKVEIIHDDIDNLDWVKFTCVLWVKYGYKQIKRLLKSRTGQKKISVEIEVVDGYVDDKGVEVITDFIFDGVTILSDKLETGIANADLNILDQINDAIFQKKQKCLAYAYNSLNKDDDKKEENKEVFSEDNIENEHTGEISMVQEGGDNKMLTYNQKREVLGTFLAQAYNGEKNMNDPTYLYVWVNDVDDEYVYFEMNDVIYKASYTINEAEEQDNKITVDLDNKEQVIRSWSKFEAEDKKDLDNSEAENKKENEEKNSGEDDNHEEEAKKPDDPEDNKEAESKKPEDNKEVENKEPEGEGKPENNKEVNACENPMEQECHFAIIGDQKFTAEELVQKFTELSTQNTELVNKYTQIETELNKYKEAEKQIEINNMISFGQTFVNSEDGLDSSEKENINKLIDETCKSEKFSTQDEVEKFVINNIATILYTKKLNETKKIQKDFSIPFTAKKDTAIEVETGIKKLQLLNKDLEKI